MDELTPEENKVLQQTFNARIEEIKRQWALIYQALVESVKPVAQLLTRLAQRLQHAGVLVLKPHAHRHKISHRRVACAYRKE